MTFNADSKSSISSTIDDINALSENNTISAIFLYTTVENRLTIASCIIYLLFICIIAIDSDLLIFYLGKVEGDNCNSNVIYVYLLLLFLVWYD